jgi:hypothetical protein
MTPFLAIMASMLADAALDRDDFAHRMTRVASAF